MKYCNECGAVLCPAAGPQILKSLRCERCGTTHAQRPTLIASCIAEWQGQVLLCRREHAPQAGLWNLPGGYVEAGEAVQAAAARETREEAQATVDDLALFRIYNLPRQNQVVAVFRGNLRDGRFAAGAESTAAALFPKRDLPWGEFAFEADRAALQDCATRRWQPAQTSPVEDLIWLQPPPRIAQAVAAATASALRRRA
jgi:ADP-ribose pyrophosphatase YjhB (NUDIX family)